MLDPQQREKLENHVRPILMRRLRHGEQLEAARGRSTLPNLLRQLRDSADRDPVDPLRAIVPGEKQSWVMTVDLALHYIGFVPAFIVVARLTRRQKSAERSWESIQRELASLDNESALADLKQMYEMAVPILAAIFEAREIDIESGSRATENTLESLRVKCAAVVAGLTCPIGTEAVA